jgi:demethylmacrocin O-methyltransferase
MVANIILRIERYLRAQPSPRKRVLTARLTRLSRMALRIVGPFRLPLATLAQISGTDKARGHNYIPAYERFFSKYRNRRITLLEIGVGGADAGDGGFSLNLWETYFRRGTIVGIDIFDKTKLSRGRVHVHQCSQVDRDGLEKIAREYGGFDLVIDDGSHINEHQIRTFNILFPLMKSRGIYVVEDTQTSYWPAYGGGAVGTAEHRASAMSFFEGLISGLNHAEFLPGAAAHATRFRSSIEAIYFEHNMAIVVKGDNSAKSNFDLNQLALALEQGSVSADGKLS